MADIKISQLPAGSTPLTGTELVPVVQSGNTYKVTTQDIADLSTAVPSLQDVLDFDHQLTNGQNYQGTLAGDLNTGTNVNALGNRAAQSNTGNKINALGNQAALNNTGGDVNALGNQAALGNIGDYVNALGATSAYSNIGSGVNAFGTNAGANNTANNLNAMGNQAAQSNTGINVNSLGYQAAMNNTGDYINASGYGAAKDNTNSNVNALGSSSAQNNSGDNVNALGNNSAQSNTGYDVNALGANAADANTGNNVNALGNTAAINNTGANVNAIGNAAGSGNTFSNVNLFGENAAATANNQTVLAGNSFQARLDLNTLAANRTFTFPNASGTLALTSDITTGTLQTVTNGAGNEITTNDLKSENNTSSTIKVRNTTNSVGAYLYQDATTSKVGIQNSAAGVSEIVNTGVTGTRTYTLPNASGTIALTSDITAGDLQTVTTAGNTTNTSIISSNASTSIVMAYNSLYNRAAYLYQDGSYSAIGIQNSGGGIAEVKATNITGTKNPELPNASSVLAVSVNGTTAATNGNITLAPFTLQQVLDNNHQLTNGINLQGTNAGATNTGTSVNALGTSAASANTGNNINALGADSAANNTGAGVNAIGYTAAFNNTGDSVNALGTSAAEGNNGNNVNAFGDNAAYNNAGDDVNAFGDGAANGNTLSGMTVFSNASMPSYVNHAAAAAAITVLLGATAGCTYLYHNQATDSIGAVRL